MALEIERRFLVHGSEWRRHVVWETDLEQAYLATGPGGLVLRVRLCRSGPALATPPAAAWLTVKAPSGAGAAVNRNDAIAAHSRLEFEYPIPPGDAEALLDLSQQRIRKRRHGLDLAGGDWVLDIFSDANAPLVLAEVELGSTDQVVAVPEWCWREVTDRRELSNAALAARPLQAWSLREREALLGAGMGPPPTEV
jgi:CYTH domain-containing protein